MTVYSYEGRTEFNKIGGMRLFRVNDIVDLPIIDRASGQRICTVKHVIVDTRENRVNALVCRQRFIRRYIEIIPYDEVIAVTQNYIMITRKGCIIRQRKLPARHGRYMCVEQILGKLIINSRGEILGIIRDLLIDSANGHIIAYELSEGYFDDLVSGRRIVWFDSSCNLADKHMVLKEYSPAYYQYRK